MPKLTLEDVSSGYQSNTTINTNNDLLETLINDQVLFRNNPEGEPNQMLNTLDMNSYPIINVGSSDAANALVTQQDLADLQDNIDSSPVLGALADAQIFTSTGSDVNPTLDYAQGYTRFTGATPASFIVPLASSVNYIMGTELHVRQVGAGVVTILPTAGVTINAPFSGSLILAGAGATVTIKLVDTDEWDLMGQVASS